MRFRATFIRAPTQLVAAAVVAVGCAAPSSPADAGSETAALDAAEFEDGVSVDSADATLADATPIDAADAALDAAPLPAPRPLWPPFAAVVSSQRPRLRWLPIGGVMAHVEVCRERACTTVEHSAISAGDQYTVPTALSAGVHFWRLTRVASDGSETRSATWEFTVRHRDAPADHAFGAVLDVNGDGYSDLAVRSADRREYVVYVYLGAPGGLGATPLRVSRVLTGGLQGGVIVSVGDIDGDGFGDLAINYAPYPAREGAVIELYRGGPAGFDGDPPRVMTVGSRTALDCGFTVSSGDVNGDGYRDILASCLTPGSQTKTWDASVVVFNGGPAGPGELPSYLVSHEALLHGPPPSGVLEAPAVADLDGDEYEDALMLRDIYNDRGRLSPGDLFLFRGSPSGLRDEPAGVRLPVGDDRAILPLVADVDGDGHADLVYHVGRDDQIDESVRVVFGSARGVVADRVALTSDPRLHAFNVISSGDSDGDGADDLIVGGDRLSGTPETPEPRPLAALFRGGSTPAAMASSPMMGSDTPTSQMGCAVLGRRDFNGDGFEDVAVTACHERAATTLPYGRVYIYFGGPAGLATTPSQILEPPPGASGPFGAILS